MDFPPFGKKQLLLVADQLHGALQIGRLHVFGPDKGRGTVSPDQVDLGLTVSEHMHMGWFVIVVEDDDAQTMRPIAG
jgi:hypothetical protein